MSKLIGVIPLWDDDKESLWMLPGYLNGVKAAGGLPIIFPMTTDKEEILKLCSVCDGFLLTGGHDVSPELYHEEKSELSVCCKARDEMELHVLHYALEKDLPVLGICRGIQFINAALGGSLYQDLPTQHPSDTEHNMSAPYDRVQHYVKIEKDSWLYQLLEIEKLGVNSYHHQAVKKVAPGLEVLAVSDDGLVEAVRMPDKKYVLAVQWHPEFSYQTDENCMKIFESFVQAVEV